MKADIRIVKKALEKLDYVNVTNQHGVQIRFRRIVAQGRTWFIDARRSDRHNDYYSYTSPSAKLALTERCAGLLARADEIIAERKATALAAAMR